MLEQVQASPTELDGAIARESAASRRRRTRDLSLSVSVPVGLLVVWEIGVLAGVIDGRLFTPPTSIIATGATMVESGQLVEDLVPSILRLLGGFSLAAVFGVLAGLAMGIWRPVRAAVGPLFTILYAVPKVAILPLFLLIFGLSDLPRVLVVFVAVFFVVQINTLAGVVQIDARTLEAAQAYGAVGVKRFRYVLLPAAMPAIFTSFRIAMGLAIVVVVAVEFVAASTGLGHLIWNSWQLFQPAQMYVGLIVVSMIGAIATGLIVVIERIALPWTRTATHSRKRRT